MIIGVGDGEGDAAAEVTVVAGGVSAPDFF